MSLIFVASCDDDQPFLPCVACAQQYKPACAVLVQGGPPQTFDSRCLVTAMDCGFKKPRKIVQKETFVL